MSAISSTVHSSYPDSDNMRRDSADSTSTNGTSTSEFLAAVATEPPCEEAWAGYLPPVDSSPVSKPRTVQEPSDILPEPNQLAEASSIPVLDSDGNEITFQELYKGGNYLAERRLVLFLRHWYCRACQAYVKYIQKLIPPASSSRSDSGSEVSTKIILIGCGHPSLIKSYARHTDCRYPIYTDPSLRLLKLLGCHRWGGVIWGFGRQSEYTCHRSAFAGASGSLYDKYCSLYRESLGRGVGGSGGGGGGGDDACGATNPSESSSPAAVSTHSLESSLTKRPSMANLRGGPIFQVGGEFLFEEGQLIWCHRMKGMRTHAEIKTLRRALGIDDDSDVMEARLESKWVEEELQELEAQGRRPSKELRRKVEKLSAAFQNDEATREALSKPISDEEEDRYLEHQLGRKPSMPAVKQGLRVVKEPNSPKARLTRDEPKVQRRPPIGTAL